VIGSAVLVSIGRLLAPQADALRVPLETWLSDALGRPVSIERVEAAWPRWSPEIWLHGLSIGQPQTRLMRIERARLQLRLYNLVRPARNSFELVAFGLDLGLVQDESGRWSWRVDRGGRFAEGWEQLISAGDVLLRDLSIRIIPNGWAPVVFDVPEASLSRRGSRLRVGLVARPPAGGAPLVARMVLEMPDSRLQRMRMHATAAELDLMRLIPSRTPGNDSTRTALEAWLNWSRSDGTRMRLDAEFEVARGGHVEPIGARLDAHWSADTAVHAELSAWSATDSGDRREFIRRLAYGVDRERRALAADRVELEFVQRMLRPWLRDHPDWPVLLAGSVRELELGWRADGSLHSASGQVQDLGLNLGRSNYGVERLDIGLAIEGDALVVTTDGTPHLTLDGLFGQPVELDGISGRVRFRTGMLEFDGLRLNHPEVEAVVDGRLQLVDGSPFVDMLIRAPRVEPRVPQRWLPRRGLPPKTQGWLADALVELGSLRATATLFGNPKRWARRAAPGELGVDAEFESLTLAYARNWPPGEGLAGRIEFLGDSMRAEITRGQVAGTALVAPRVEIDDLRAAELEIELRTGDSDASGLARLTHALPLLGARDALERMRWSGSADARATLWYPVRQRENWRLLGRVDFTDAALALDGAGIGMHAIRGTLPFTRRGLGPAELDGELRGESARFTIDGRWEPEFRLELDGRFPARGVVPQSWLDRLPSAFSKLDGRADFRFRFATRPPLAGVTDAERPVLVLRIDSDLAGIGIELPRPLDKPRDDAWPLRAWVPLGSSLLPVRFDLDERFHGVLLVDERYWQLGMTLGQEAAEPALPTAENFIVEGALGTLELDRWITILGDFDDHGPAASESTAPTRLSGWLDVGLDGLDIARAGLGPVDLKLGRSGDYWQLDADGPNVAGTVRFPASTAADRSLVFNFDRLYWPVPDPDIEHVWPEPAPPTRFDPRRLPTVSALIRDLRWGELDVGELRLTTHQDPQGLQIEQLSARRDGLELIGSGAWNRADDELPSTRMRLRLAAGNLGQSLRQAGFNLGLEGGQASVELTGRWPGSPLDFRLQRADGTLDVEIDGGALAEAGPGAGRLLGLVSLGSIPRRLRLDFSDVFGEGLAFDRIAGQFRLDPPMAITDALKVSAPAADITISGRTDLARRTYDQLLTVRPGVSSTLPIIGLLAGGPVGAAAGAALDQIFSRPLKGISEIRYSVTGSWSSPKIEPVGATPVPDSDDKG